MISKSRDKIIDYFNGLEAGTVVSANELYETHFAKMSQAAFFKAMERLVKDGVLTRAAKGMYIMKQTEDGEDMLNYFFGENNDNGMFIGQRLYEKYGISDYKSETIELYSNLITKATCNVCNIHVKRVDVELTYENARVIEALEIMQNYDKIVNLNKQRFAKFAKMFAKGYDDEAAVYVLSKMKYKKCTIAFMKKVLDMYKVPNSLQHFLSYSSKYKVPPVQRVAR